MRTYACHRFSRTVSLAEAEISRFAAAVGDTNPLHHDAAQAARTRYAGLIASGSQTSALLMGLVASHFSRSGPMVGLDFSFRFRAPVRAGVPLYLEWLVVRVSPTTRGSGEIVELRGRLRTFSGITAVGAKGRVLLTSKRTDTF